MLFRALFMSIGRMLMRLGRVLLRLARMLMSRRVVVGAAPRKNRIYYYNAIHMTGWIFVRSLRVCAKRYS
jgi:hypothetical protein